MKNLHIFLLLNICCGLTSGMAVHFQERDILSGLESFASSLFVGPETTTAKSTKTSKATKTTADASSQVTSFNIGPPVTATSTPDSDSDTATSTDSDSSTTTSDASTTSTTDSSTITSAPSTTTLPTITSISSVTPTPTASVSSQAAGSSSSSNSSVPTGGIVAGVILGLAFLGTVVFIIFRYCKPVRRRFDAWEEKKRQERSYREALDGPNSGNSVRAAAFGPESENITQPTRTAQPQGLGITNAEKRKTRPFSFFVTQPPPFQIKRKPLPKANDQQPIINQASPMGQQ